MTKIAKQYEKLNYQRSKKLKSYKTRLKRQYNGYLKKISTNNECFETEKSKHSPI